MLTLMKGDGPGTISSFGCIISMETGLKPAVLVQQEHEVPRFLGDPRFAWCLLGHRGDDCIVYPRQ
eukprot:4251390-Amphidinium_carterae.1